MAKISQPSFKAHFRGQFLGFFRTANLAARAIKKEQAEYEAECIRFFGSVAAAQKAEME